MKLKTTLFLMLLLTSGALAQESVPSPSPSPEFSASPELQGLPLDGSLQEKGTKAILGGVNVFVLPHKLKAVTDEKGKFHFDSVPVGPFQLVVNLAGYERLERQGFQRALDGGQIPVKLYIERSDYLVYETTVYGKDKKRDDTTKSIGQKEFFQAGTGGDPIRAVQNLPGVNRTAALGAQVVIQGSAPNQTRYLIDNHEVPIIFHFGGLSSVVMPEALERVDYLSAGYGPENGRALGGLVGVWTRSPKRERFKGFAFVDTFNAGLQAEGPVGEDGGYLISGRQSYVGFVLKAAAGNSDNFDLTVAPEFKDISGIYETRLTGRDDFKFVAVASDDTLEFLLKEPVKGDPSVRGSFSNNTSFYRLIPQLTHKHSETRLSRFSLGYGRDSIRFNVGSDFFRLSSEQLTARVEHEWKPGGFWTSFIGVDNRYRYPSVDIQLPAVSQNGGVSNPISTGGTRIQKVTLKFSDVALYWRNQIQVPETRFTVMPNARFEYTNQTNQFLSMPRLAVRYGLDDSLFLRAAGGLYYQPPQEAETSAVFGNPNLKATSAWHGTLGVEKDFREGRAEGWTVSSGVFYRKFLNLVKPSTTLVVRDGVQTSENYNNSSEGKSYGAEALVKYQDRQLSAWLAYTVSRSTRFDATQGDYIFRFDQTHLLTALASLDVKGNWRFSARVRYVTGNPFTPVVGGSFDVDNDVYIPVAGPFYSQRVNPFFQTDLRIDKKFIDDRVVWSVYLEILNATNRANIEQIQYSYNFQQSESVSGLPIVPLLGVKAEF